MGKVKITFYGALVTVTQMKTVEVDVSELKEALDILSSKYGERFKDRLYDEKGKVRRFINLYVNGKDVRFLNQLNTQLKEGDNVSIIPAVGGG